jgi:hypothetical protein
MHLHYKFNNYRCYLLRNKARNEGAQPNPHEPGQILAYVELIKENLFRQEMDKRCEPNVLQKWTPPPSGFVLLNSDAAIFDNLGAVGVGVVARNHLGHVWFHATIFSTGPWPQSSLKPLRFVELLSLLGMNKWIR